MSYVNMIMYASVLPSYNSDKDKTSSEHETINADDPQNRDHIQTILFG